MEILNITAQQLRKAADLQEKIQSLKSELGQILGGAGGQAQPVADGAPKKRRMSAAGRARISRAAKARWAKLRGAAPAKTVSRRKRKLSAAGRAALSAAAKARWKKSRALGKSTL
jgi:hypothetical protein